MQLKSYGCSGRGDLGRGERRREVQSLVGSAERWKSGKEAGQSAILGWWRDRKMEEVEDSGEEMR